MQIAPARPALDSPHWRRYQKAKQLAWDPAALDFARDRQDWARMSPEEQDAGLRAVALFLGGEEAVAADLAPLLIRLRDEPGHKAACYFLASQIWEEAKHAELFARWIDEVAGSPDLTPYSGASYTTFFEEDLPAALDAVLTDRSPEALVRAVTTYHLMVEGTLAETGYHGFYASFQDNGILPGIVEGIRLVQRDEARHVAFGIDLLRDWFARDPALQGVMEERVDEVFELVIGTVADYFAPYGGEASPLGLTATEMLAFASSQLSKRLHALER